MAAAVLNAEGWVERLKQPGFALQLLAPNGRGKTTHLLALAQQLPEGTYHRATRSPMPDSGEPARGNPPENRGE
jgi:ABC-type hemin transport system ATPase subunit